jgi:hypothetical protein
VEVRDLVAGADVAHTLELPKNSAQAISAELAKCSSNRQTVQAARKAVQMTGETS